MEKLKKFKKTLVLLSLALVLALVWTTGASTYAKYITSTTVPAQTATVAKWGFIINAETTNLFGDAYGKATSNLSSVVAYDSAVNVKASSANSNLVAPGTTGSMTFTIGGSAEVLSKITVSVTDGSKDVYLTKTKTEDNSTETYNPIKWTLKKGDTTIKTGTLAEVVTAITNGLEIYKNGDTTITTNGGTIQPNTEITSTTFTLSWEWAFDNTAASGITGLTGDQADTILGQFANGTDLPTEEGYTYSAEKQISIGLTITIEQIQTEA